MDEIETFELEDVKAVRETSKAILVDWQHGEDWIPKSQIQFDSEVNSLGDVGTLIISEWFATQKGW